MHCLIGAREEEHFDRTTQVFDGCNCPRIPLLGDLGLHRRNQACNFDSTIDHALIAANNLSDLNVLMTVQSTFKSTQRVVRNVEAQHLAFFSELLTTVKLGKIRDFNCKRRT